ncbi:MAG: thioredoxin-like domain-containing protein [Micavibrio sp.]|nr:thioredoxin-like domain-containing protein [Micavibrio sp.]
MHRILLSFVIAAFLLLPAAARAGSGVDGYSVLFTPTTPWINTARPLTADDAKGRLVLLDFWTYGCINCMQIVPDLKALEAKYGDKLLVIGVHSAKFAGERGDERIAAAAKRFGITHAVINDAKFDVWDAYNVNAWPTQILLDDHGLELNRYAGEGHREEIAADIDRALPNIATTAAPIAGVKMAAAQKTTLSFPGRLGFAPETPWGELLFIDDSGHNRLLGVTLKGDIKVTIGSGAEGRKDGDFASATFNHPRGFGLAKDGLYVADTANHLVRYVDFKTKTVSTAAGTGLQGSDRRVNNDAALETALASPWDVKMLADNRTLLIAMAGLHQIWQLDTVKKTLSVAAGSGKEDIKDGDADDAALAQPSGLSPDGNTVYFVDAESSALRTLKFGQVGTLVGTGLFDFGRVDGSYPKALLQHAQGLDVNAGRIAVADTYNNAVRLYDLKSSQLSTVALKEGTLEEPGDVLQLNGKIYVADTNHNRIAIVDDKTATAETLDIKEAAAKK